MSPGRQVLGIRRRVLTIGLLGTCVALGLMVFAGHTLSVELGRRERQEQVLRARLVADRIDRVLTSEVERLEAVGARIATRLEEPAALRAELHALQRRGGKLFDQLFVLGLDGAVRMEESRSQAPLDGPALVRKAVERRRPVFTPLEMLADGSARLYVVVPIRAGPGEIVAVLGAGMEPGSSALEALLDTPNLPREASVDLVDTNGLVLASSDPRRRQSVGDHDHQLADQILLRRAWSGACHDCHEDDPRPSREQFALSPLAAAPWGVKVREPDEIAHAFAASVAGRVTAAGVGLLAMMLVLAFGASRAVTGPLASLTQSAERLAQGALEEPIPPLPSDEIGRLGAALERMRLSLRDALAEIERANGELEARVEVRTRELAKLNVALQHREAEKAEALRRVITAQEEERRRIARELHDETSQSLAALAIGLDGLRRGDTLDATARAQLDQASAVAVRTLNAVHGLCKALRPPVLDDLGLPSAIKWVADQSLAPRGISVRCEFTRLEERLPREVETALFRCAQEAITNIARHARAETVLVQCTRTATSLTLEVEDDGQGFDPASVRASEMAGGRGLGLLGIRERVELLKGTVELTSAPGEGTRVAIEVPLGQEMNQEVPREVPDVADSRRVGG